ncbi:MAG: hypothetical protein ACOYJX_06510 [Acutalibacteraceae bacterium]
MKNKKSVFISLLVPVILIVSFVLGFFNIVTFSDSDNELENARLVGVFITRERPVFSEIDSYLKKTAEKCEDRLYAELVDKRLTDEAGEESMSKEYIFEGIEGYRMMEVKIGDGDSGYKSLIVDEEISQVSIAKDLDDNGEKVAMRGTVNFLNERSDSVFYSNPVYQNAEGKVFALRGTGMTPEGVDGPGSSFRCKSILTEEKNISDANEEKVREINIEINFSGMEKPKSFTLVQFDKNSKELMRTEFNHGNLPEQFTVQKGTEYIIVGTESISGSKQIETYKKGDEYLSFLYPKEDGICIERKCETVW